MSLHTTNHDYYPAISDELIECLERDFPNKLPTKLLSEYELGILIGEQKIIDKLRLEKEYIEQEATESDDD